VSDQSDRVRMAAEDARSGDDLVNPGMLPQPWPGEPPLDSPLDKETLDEQASTQMGGWDARRRDAD
jgi:hypothetical protein